MIKRQQKQLFNQSSESGLTIIECLIAMLMVSIIMAAIAPVVALSVASRVQARRIELGTQAARAYIDGVSSGAIASPNHAITLNEIDSTTKQFSPQRGTFASVAAPTSSGSLTCTTSTTDAYCTNTTTASLYCIDRDGNGCSATSINDLVVQAFRTSNVQNYILGVRVYRANAFGDTNTLKTQKQMGGQQATFSRGLGNLKAPLIEMTTEISAAQPNFKDYCTRLGGCNN